MRFTSDYYGSRLIIVGCFLMNTSVGDIFSYGYLPNNSLYVLTNDYDKALSQNQSVIMSSGLFAMGLSISMVSLLISVLGTSLTLILAGLLKSLTVFGLAATSHPCVRIGTFGLLNGIGVGIVYGVTMDIACKHFPRRRGSVCGVIVASIPLGVFFFNRADLALECILKSKWKSIVSMGAISLILQLLGICMLLKYRLPTSPEMHEESCLLPQRSSDPSQMDLRPLQLIKKTSFWSLWLTYFFLISCMGINISLYRNLSIHFKIYPSNDYFNNANISGLLAFAFGGLSLGVLVDVVGYKVLMYTISSSVSVVMAASACLTSFHEQIGNNIHYLFIAWVVLLYFIPAGTLSIFPYICARTFGKSHFISNYGLFCTAWTLSCALFLLLTLLSEINNHNTLVLAMGSGISFMKVIGRLPWL